MKKIVICILFFSMYVVFGTSQLHAQRDITYPYGNYLNWKCDDPSSLKAYITAMNVPNFPPTHLTPTSDIRHIRALAFNFPQSGEKPESVMVYGIAISLTPFGMNGRSPEEWNGAMDRDIVLQFALYQATVGSPNLQLIKEQTGYIYKGKIPDVRLWFNIDRDIWNKKDGNRSDWHFNTENLFEFYFDTPVNITGPFLATAYSYDSEAWCPRGDSRPCVVGITCGIDVKNMKLVDWRNGIESAPSCAPHNPYIHRFDTLGVPFPDVIADSLVTGLTQWIFPILVPEGTTAAPEEGEEDTEVLLTPNPAAGQVTLATERGIRSVEVWDMAGHTVEKHSYDALPRSVTLDVSGLPAGVYAMRVETPQGMVTKKLVVEK